MFIKLTFLILFLFCLAHPLSEAKTYKAPYQVEKSGYFKKMGKTGYFRSTEPSWYEKPFVWMGDGAKAVGNAVKEIASSF